jgi:hypothetical protein
MPGITLAQLLARKVKDAVAGPLETGRHADKNPLGVRVGGLLTIDGAEDRGLFYSVESIAHAVETVGGKPFPFTDYHLKATPSSNDDRADDSGWVRRVLRLVPAEEKDHFLTCHCLVLSLFYECGYEQAADTNLYVHGFEPTGREGETYPVLQDPKGEFHDFETDTSYSRRFRGSPGWLDPHVVDYTVLRDADGNGRVDENEVEERRQVRFWDYEREAPAGTAGRTRPEYLYVEQDADGYFRLYRGREVPPEAITRL